MTREKRGAVGTDAGMITTYVYDKVNKRLLKENGSIKKYVGNNDFVIWVDVEQPTAHDLLTLQESFHLHDLVIDDIKKFTSLPKIDIYEEYMFLIFHRIYFDARKRKLVVKEIDFALGKNYLVSTHERDFKSTISMRKKIEAMPTFMGHGPDFILHGIIDFFIDHYMPIINVLDDELESIEEDIIQESNKNLMERLLTIKRQITEFKKSLGPQRDFIDRINRAHTQFISDKAEAYFKDIADHIHRAYINLDALRDISTSTFDAYMSTISSKLAATSNKLNSIMHRLTIIATIFMPITFIASVYGMNFRNMPELNWHYGYFMVLGIIVVTVIIMLNYFRKNQLM